MDPSSTANKIAHYMNDDLLSNAMDRINEEGTYGGTGEARDLNSFDSYQEDSFVQ